jgi:hydroxyethylthiazole kinase-like uncharacterized protein yjeF
VSLPDWCTPLADATRMRAIDRWAIEEQGVPGIELMEGAGLAVARAAEEVAPSGPVAIVCGKGNNGGDGFVAARILRDAGREVRVLCTGALDGYRGDARTSLRRLPGEPPLQHAFGGEDEEAWSGERAGAALGDSAAVIDALLGTGFQGVPHGAVARAIGLIEACGRPVVSIDVPSGVDASSGVVEGPAVHATLTVTFQLAKPGLWIMPGKAHAGHVRVADIGIPRGALEATAQAAREPPREPASQGLAVGLIEGAVARELPGRGAAATKFTSGHVVVVGGSRGLTGAPRMTAQAAMRAGAGYVTLCVPACVQPVIAATEAVELVTRGLAERDGGFAEDALDEALSASERGGAVALGTGLGRGGQALAFARALARRVAAPLVLDADGLNAHVGHLDELAQRSAPTVLTPHAGELGRLLERSSAEIDRARLASVRTAAERSRAVVLLKGDDTLVAAPQGIVAVNPGATPALATAGTGDVLTGVIAALLAAGLDAFTATAAGALLHAAAGGEAARRQQAVEGVIASDVIAALPATRARLAARWRDSSRSRDAARAPEHAG